MNATPTAATVNPAALPSLTTIRDLLELLSSFRNLSDPFTSADSLRATLELLVRLGRTLGIHPNWLAWLHYVRDNAQLTKLLVAIGQYLESLLNPSPSSTPISATQSQTIHPQAINLTQLLPLILLILQLLQHARKPD